MNKVARFHTPAGMDRKSNWSQVLEKMKMIESKLQNVSDSVEEKTSAEDMQHRKDAKALCKKLMRDSKPRNLCLADKILIHRAHERMGDEGERRTASVPPLAATTVGGSMSSIASAPPAPSDEFDLPDCDLTGSPRYSKEELRILKRIADEVRNRPDGADSPSGINQEQLDKLIDGDFDEELEKIITARDL